MQGEITRESGALDRGGPGGLLQLLQVFESGGRDIETGTCGRPWLGTGSTPESS